MIDEKYKYSALTGKIIGCALEVHKVLGNGFQEVIYQRALEVEFKRTGILYHREFEMPIIYKNEHVGTRRVDFLVEEHISVELKAIIKLENVHFAQAINYLEAYNLEVGLLLNFGSESLEMKRLLNSKYKSI
ncbi:MAG: GxxExxY protein [Emticicia sp.]|uniref:GxxExxY protein n=1 Tax=unclassified Emticicia TaxID=2627301 RepID=UPI0033065C85